MSNKHSQSLAVFTVPIDTFCDPPSDAFSKFKKATSDAAHHFEYQFPPLMAGTIDNLMTCNESLETMMQTSQSIMKTVCQACLDIETAAGNKKAAAHVHGLISEIIEAFKWDERRFSTRHTLPQLIPMITGRLQSVERDVSAAMKEFATITSEIAALEKEVHGSLQVQSVSAHLEPQDIISTDYLTTRLVTVPAGRGKEWRKTYEYLDEFVVPRSDKLIAKDAAFELHRVVMFHKAVDGFTRAAREAKFLLRNWTPETEMTADSAADRLDSAESKSESMVARLQEVYPAWLTEAATACIHTTVMAAFVDAVLRFGTPTEYHCLACSFVDGKQRSLMVQAEKLLGDRKSDIYDRAGAGDGFLSFSATVHKF